MGHPNAELVRRFFQAVVGKDFATMESLIHQDFVGHISGNNQVSGTYKGMAEFGAALQKSESLVDSIERELHDVTASDDHAVGLVNVRATRGGTTHSWRGAVVWHVRDGKLAEAWMLADDQAAVDQAFA